jgi:hypothetical protein
VTVRRGKRGRVKRGGGGERRGEAVLNKYVSCTHYAPPTEYMDMKTEYEI